ncbi:hypothetical protein [Magnetospirillum sulfuroxidans]|uniref:Glycoside-hydrolase family GH114 TIM-barrel domain-containing protein n=1 Tax=Magnetospirillum sulfuroxidans TaxID=611300 RepID=A0ABS5IEQ6_9PROT|nr:hypothetical protein [Magnetospirillum sulfuroxidans]MBR9972829.1 hypothetical protein [Magnetospirillum sulfuroxidans]
MSKLAAAVVPLFLLLAAPALALDKPRDWQPPPPEAVPNHREIWRSVVIELGRYAKARKNDFVVLVRNGSELVVKGGREAEWDEVQDPDGRFFEKRHPLGQPFRPYVNAVDGLVMDNLYCGAEAFGKPLDQAIKERQDLDKVLADERARGVYRPALPQPMGPFSIDPAEEIRRAAEVKREAEKLERQRRSLYAIDAMRQAGRRILSLEQCKTAKDVQAAYRDGIRDRVLTYAHDGDEVLNRIPSGHPWGENADPVPTLNQARNWLPVLRANQFGSKAEWVGAMERTNHDMLLVDVAYRGVDGLSYADVLRLKYKKLGSRRLVFAVLSLGRAYDWRWYWQKDWRVGAPPFLFAPDSDDPGAYITVMENAQWKELLGKTLVGIVDAGFDGVVLDDTDTYLWFEELMPLR